MGPLRRRAGPPPSAAPQRGRVPRHVQAARLGAVPDPLPCAHPGGLRGAGSWQRDISTLCGVTGGRSTITDNPSAELHRLLGSDSAGGLSAPQVLQQPLHDVHEAVGFSLDAGQRVVVPRVPEQPAGQSGVSAVPAARSPAPSPYSPRGDTAGLQGTVILQPLLGGHTEVVLPQHQQHGRADLRGARLSNTAMGGCRGWGQGRGCTRST